MKFHNSNDAYQYIIENTKLPEKLQYNKILYILQVCISETDSYQLKNTISQLATASESIEEAVARELNEEAGIKIIEANYHSSQPWAFPYSLMIGYIAESKTENFTGPS